MKRAWFLTLALLSFGGSQMGGCGGGGHIFIPLVSEVVVVNTADTFTVTLVGFGYDGTIDRMWPCSASQAKVTLGTSMFGGSVHIVIRDNANTVVYDNIHSGTTGGLTVQTAPGGVAGTWRVVFDFNNASWSGAIVLDADNPPQPDTISIGSGIGGSDSYLFHAGWDTTTVPVHVSVATGLSSGSVRIRIWDPGTPTTNPAPYDVTVTSASAAVSDDILTGGPGTWTIQIDFSGATLGGAIDLTN